MFLSRLARPGDKRDPSRWRLPLRRNRGIVQGGTMELRDEDPEILEDIFQQAQLALVDARARVAWCEYELSRLTREHPDVAARVPPLHEYTVADLRSDGLYSAVRRINALLGWGLTGEEADYWLKLEAYARETLDLCDDDFQHMTVDGPVATLEALAAFIEDRLEGPKGIPISERRPLLESYRSHLRALGRAVSDRQIYRAKNRPTDEHAFKDWKSGKLPRTSQTAISIERFLQNRTIPVRRTVPTT